MTTTLVTMCMRFCCTSKRITLLAMCMILFFAIGGTSGAVRVCAQTADILTRKGISQFQAGLDLQWLGRQIRILWSSVSPLLSQSI